MAKPLDLEFEVGVQECRIDQVDVTGDLDRGLLRNLAGRLSVRWFHVARPRSMPASPAPARWRSYSCACLLSQGGASRADFALHVTRCKGPTSPPRSHPCWVSPILLTRSRLGHA